MPRMALLYLYCKCQRVDCNIRFKPCVSDYSLDALMYYDYWCDCMQRVLFRVNDHYTRVRVRRTTEEETQTNDMGPYRSVGCLLGEQHGHVIRISTCFDMALVPDPSGETTFSSIDWDLLQRKLELYREMEPSVDIVGWYLTAADLCEEDAWMHRKFLNVNPASVLLVFNLHNADTAHALQIYESEEYVLDGKKQIRFTKGMHELVSNEVERIVVNQFSDLSVSEDVNRTSMCLQTQQTDLHSAVVTLIERVSQLQTIVIEMRDGIRPYNAQVVSAIAAFINRLPKKETVPCQSVSPLVEKQKESLLTTLIASTMAGLSSLEEHAELDAVLYHHAPTAVTPETH